MNLENVRGIRGVERLQRFSLYLLALSLLCGVQKGDNLISVMYWETIARNLKKRGWSSGYVSAVVICSNPRVQLAPRLPQRLLPRLTTAATPAAGGGHGLVWVNTEAHVYHKEGSRFYGKTKKGKYVSEADAIKEGDRAAAKGQ